MPIPQQLKDIAEKVKRGEAAETTVRTLLSWFGAYRRSWRNVKFIQDSLNILEIITFPDFEGEYIDGTISFKAKPAPQKYATAETSSTTTTTTATPSSDTSAGAEQIDSNNAKATQLADPAHRISRLRSANRPPISVPPDATVGQAITLMLRHDYSQLPVMQSNREVKGLISWKSLGARLAVGRSCDNVRDCMDESRELFSDASLFDAVQIIAEHDCVVVRATDKTVCGIVTAYDISAQFQQLTEPFLLLGEIENHIRYLISNTFELVDMQRVKDATDTDRKIEDVSDLTFGEYVRLLQNNENWTKLNMRIDRKMFTDWLDKVREIRNDVMHFDPDPIESADLQLLKDFARFLQRWQQLTA